MSGSPKFTVQDAKCALEDILQTFVTPEWEHEMNSARDKAGNDMVKFMQHVFPLATQIQMTVIPKYGFPGDGEGLIRFTQLIKMHEKQSKEISELNSQLRAIVMPRMPLPHTTTGAAPTPAVVSDKT